MTQSDTEQRANRNGHPCPPWCSTDHDRLVLDDKPEYGYMNVHLSDPVVAGNPAVRLALHPSADTAAPVIEVQYTRSAPPMPLQSTIFSASQAEFLSVLVRDKYGDQDMLADQLLAAVAIAREAR